MTNVRLSVKCHGNTEKELMSWKEELICVTGGLSPEDCMGSQDILCRRIEGHFARRKEQASKQCMNDDCSETDKRVCGMTGRQTMCSTFKRSLVKYQFRSYCCSSDLKVWWAQLRQWQRILLKQKKNKRDSVGALGWFEWKIKE